MIPRRRVARWLVLATLACAVPAQAVQLQCDDQGLSASERAASRALLDAAQARLPPVWAAELPASVPVQWRDDLPPQVHGRALARRVLLNKQLLRDWMAANAGTDPATDPARRPALAALLHELAHVYDHSAAGRLSSDPRLLDLAGWQVSPMRLGLRRGHNALTERSPDRYELESPAEYVAVNLEHVLLDPDYVCRRPALADYFAQRLAWTPPPARCAPGLAFVQDPLAEQALLVQVDPARVYAVDYLLAEGNTQPMSRWGHSMLRLVICAPGRPLGPQCRLDLADHLVLSFRAFVNDVQISNLRGLIGSYPSRLFVLPLHQVIDDYTQVQLRGLQSLPLNLRRDEIAALLERAGQLHWSYDGRYYFLSNNCAVETYALLHDAVPRLSAAHLSGITPTGLRQRLLRAGIADASVLENNAAAVRQGYYFPAASAYFAEMFAVARAGLALPARNVDAWLDLPAAQRAAWLQRGDLRASAALLLLENAARLRAEMRARDALKRRYLRTSPWSALVRSGGSLDPAGDTHEAAAAVRAVLAQQGLLSQPSSLLQGQPGYGLPQAQERAWLQEQSQVRIAALRADGTALRKRLRDLLPPPLQAELEQVDTNLSTLGARLRTLNREGGGLQLSAPSRLQLPQVQ
ncbi:hypothetical protein XALC_1329 [Xanthomonas albilineans GPE PC73]|uniref:Uncharacterized protein n=1 Tax=Xanthomonas albilineans (strain GPE PC73 / CFBP 7063) TaxID=380358 RepID=D2UA74_XANAP|nr:DUF4105 domain-containing protein [Xanthomonas albilineans]CBA15836.1 hypothetical protein XALC_1329 [Xanthomonas albilineans GPE PC73]